MYFATVPAIAASFVIVVVVLVLLALVLILGPAPTRVSAPGHGVAGGVGGNHQLKGMVYSLRHYSGINVRYTILM